jgi:uncharacterized protein YndB with AHSA1/START domain
VKKPERKPTGLTKDAGWQVGIRRTYPISHVEAWKLLTSPEGIQTWLGNAGDFLLTKGSQYELADGTMGEVKVLSANSHLRITWHPKEWPGPSTIQIRVIPKEGHSVIAFHQEHLPGPNERAERKVFFKRVLDTFEKWINDT